MLSSITSMMHQFYIEHRKHWWIFDVTLMFHPYFQCFSTLKPAIFHLLNINKSSMNHQWWITDEANDCCQSLPRTLKKIISVQLANITFNNTAKLFVMWQKTEHEKYFGDGFLGFQGQIKNNIVWKTGNYYHRSSAVIYLGKTSHWTRFLNFFKVKDLSSCNRCA